MGAAKKTRRPPPPPPLNSFPFDASDTEKRDHDFLSFCPRVLMKGNGGIVGWELGVFSFLFFFCMIGVWGFSGGFDRPRSTPGLHVLFRIPAPFPNVYQNNKLLFSLRRRFFLSYSLRFNPFFFALNGHKNVVSEVKEYVRESGVVQTIFFFEKN